MRLYFLRHGIAEDNLDNSMSDFSRALTPKGIQRTKDTGHTLKAIDLKLTRLYSSPLVRAQQTAAILGEILGVTVTERDELGPGFGLEAVVELMQDFNDDDALMFVGHEPDSSATVSRIIGGGDIVMKKGSLARIDVLTREPLHGMLVWLIPPKAFSILDLG